MGQRLAFDAAPKDHGSPGAASIWHTIHSDSTRDSLMKRTHLSHACQRVPRSSLIVGPRSFYQNNIAGKARLSPQPRVWLVSPMRGAHNRSVCRSAHDGRRRVAALALAVVIVGWSARRLQWPRFAPPGPPSPQRAKQSRRAARRASAEQGAASHRAPSGHGHRAISKAVKA